MLILVVSIFIYSDLTFATNNQKNDQEIANKLIKEYGTDEELNKYLDKDVDELVAKDGTVELKYGDESLKFKIKDDQIINDSDFKVVDHSSSFFNSGTLMFVMVVFFVMVFFIFGIQIFFI